MPGFMGLRGLEKKNPHDMARERREDHKAASRSELERRSREKVQEILRDQEGDMSAFSGNMDESRGECDKIARLPVEKIMTGRVAVLSFDDTLLTVQGIFNSVKFRHLPVVDDHGCITGIISDRDFLRTVSPFFGTINEQTRDKEIMARKVGMIMTRHPLCTTPGTTLHDVVQLMNEKKISCVPVVEKGSLRLLGIVTWKDVVRAFCPSAFSSTQDSNRLKTGVNVNPETSESERLRSRNAESARLRAAAAIQSAASESARLKASTAQNGEERGDTKVLREPPGPSDSSRFDPVDMARLKTAAGASPQLTDDAETAKHHNPSDSTVLRVKTSEPPHRHQPDGEHGAP